MTARESPEISAEQARSLTDKIKIAVEGTWHLIIEAYQSNAWLALGYSSWDDYTTREFGTSRLRLPREERSEVIGSLRDAGLSIRAIVAATGISDKTIQRDLRQVSESTTPARVELLAQELADSEDVFESEAAEDEWSQRIANELAASDETHAQTAKSVDPTPIKGLDGKTYNPKPAAAPRRPELASDVRPLSEDLRRLTNRIQKLRADDRLSRNKDQVAALMRNHLTDAIEVCQDLLDAL